MTVGAEASVPIKPMKIFIAATLAVGAIRFALSIAGLPNGTVKYASMTVISTAGAIYFALACQNWKQRLKAAYLLVLPYMTVEVAALGYSWATGAETIFHAPEYSLGTSLRVHFFGHLIGGLSWEPLTVFILMQIVAFFKPRKAGAAS